MSAESQLYINLGSGHVSISEIDNLTSSGGVLKSYHRESLDYNYLDEDQWLGATTSALRRLASFNKISGSTHVILPGFVLLAKAIKVPHVDPSRQAQIIAFEAQQNIPYPMNEVVWTHQIVHDDGVEADVLLVAIKADMAEAICKMLASLKLDPVSLLASPVLDYNAYRFNRPEEESEFLLVNIGMRSTNLAFGSKDNLTLRNVALGGNALTQTIANNLGKNFSEAEALKVAYYSTEEPDPNHEFATIFNTNSEGFIRRIQSDVMRTLTNYKRQTKGKGPSRVVLTGCGSLLPGLPEFFAEKLGMDVEYLNPLERMRVGSGANAELVDRYGFQLGELVGAAAAVDLPGMIKLDLLPKELVEQRRFQRQKPIVVAAAVILGASFIYPFISTQGRKAELDQEIRDVRARTAPLERSRSEIQRIQGEIDVQLGRITRLRNSADSLYNWSEFLVDLQNRLDTVGDIWIESLQVDRSSLQPTAPTRGRGGFGGGRDDFGEEQPQEERPLELRVQGRILDRANPVSRVSREVEAKVTQFISSMQNSPFLNRVSLDQLDNSQPGVLRFEFTMAVNPEKPL